MDTRRDVQRRESCNQLRPEMRARWVGLNPGCYLQPSAFARFAMCARTAPRLLGFVRPIARRALFTSSQSAMGKEPSGIALPDFAMRLRDSVGESLRLVYQPLCEVSRASSISLRSLAFEDGRAPSAASTRLQRQVFFRKSAFSSRSTKSGAVMTPETMPFADATSARRIGNP